MVHLGITIKEFEAERLYPNLSMKKLLVLIALMAATAASASAQMLLVGYDFTNGTAASSTTPPSSYLSAFGTEAGTAALYLDGTHGSSAFITATGTGNEVNGVAGSTVNAGTGFSTTTTSPSALSFKGGTSESANGKMAVFTLSMTGYSSLVMTFATQRSSTGFTGNTFSYSLNGTAFTPISGISIVPAASYAVATADFSSVTALNNAATVYIAYNLAGATSTTGSNFLDNIQFNAVPEPASVVYILGGIGLLASIYRRKRAA